MGQEIRYGIKKCPISLLFKCWDGKMFLTQKVDRDLMLENLSFCRLEKGLYLYGYVILSNPIHLIVRQKECFKGGFPM